MFNEFARSVKVTITAQNFGEAYSVLIPYTNTGAIKSFDNFDRKPDKRCKKITHGMEEKSKN